MSLPNIVTPEYTVQLKSIKNPVRFRPYLVKEEKVFLTAKESNDPEDIQNAVRQILKNCTFGEINVNKLPSFDIEFLFLQLRAKSVNNIIEVRYRCENMVTVDAELKPCHHINSVRINIDDVRIETPEGHTTTVAITDDLTLEFQYPCMDSLGLMTRGSAEQTAPIIASCIKTIVEKDGKIHEAIDYSKEDMQAFVESMPISSVQKCNQFFLTMPKVRVRTQFACTKCGYNEPITLEGLDDFFE